MHATWRTQVTLQLMAMVECSVRRMSSALKKARTGSAKRAAAKHESAPRKTGRPTKLTDAVADEIIELISAGTPLMQVCRMDGMPALRTVYDWLERDPKLSARFTHARTAGFDQIAMDMLRIADTPVTAIKQTVRTWKGKKSVDVTTEDAIAHRKLQIETRAKLLACWDPKRYGTQRTEVDMTAHLPDVAKATTQLDEILGLLASK